MAQNTIKLIRVENNHYRITLKSGTTELFPSIESASDILIDLDVTDDEIDNALIQLFGLEHKTAYFENGKFLYSE